MKLLNYVMNAMNSVILWLQTTPHSSGGAVTNCCANCVEPSRTQQRGPNFPFRGKIGLPPLARVMEVGGQQQ